MTYAIRLTGHQVPTLTGVSTISIGLRITVYTMIGLIDVCLVRPLNIFCSIGNNKTGSEYKYERFFK